MTPMESLINWFKKPKTIQGIAGMVVIIIVLALDFAYWAGAIEVGGVIADDVEEEEGEEIELEEMLVYHFEQEDTIMVPGFGQIGGGSTTRTYDFPIEENASRAEIITTHTGTNLRPDVDLYVYDPSGDQVGSSASESAEETVKLDHRDFERHGTGSYTADVHNFSNLAVTYKITIDVYYFVPANQTEGGD